MKNKKYFTGLLVIGIAGLLLLTQTPDVYAKPHGGPKHHDRHHAGKRYIHRPGDHSRTVFRGWPYFYLRLFETTRPRTTYVVAPQPAADTVTVNIPNSNGSYTQVMLQRSGNGYISPQGEYYPNHPTIEQLQALYGN